MVTTSGFSREALVYSEHSDPRIVLVDGQTLARYLFEFDVGVREENVYPVKKIDEDFFEDE